MGWELNWEELGTGGTLLDRHFVNSYWIPNDHVEKECRKVVMGSRNRTHASKQLPNIITLAPILVTSNRRNRRSRLEPSGVEIVTAVGVFLNRWEPVPK